MVMLQADPIGAMVTYLRARPSVAAIAGNRVFGVELPAPEAAHMPRTAVVVTGSGRTTLVSGVGANSYVEAGNRRFDVRCYGATHAQATALDMAVYLELKHLRRAQVNGMLLYAAYVESTGINMRDDEGRWPMALSVYVVTVSEQAIPAPA